MKQLSIVIQHNGHAKKLKFGALGLTTIDI